MQTFHKNLKSKLDEYVHLVYLVSKEFPRAEIYGVTSQLRRSSLSVVLNYIEGFARNNDKVLLNFLKIAYASLKESEYLLEFSLVEKYLSQGDYDSLAKLADEVGAMLWKTIEGITRRLQSYP